jgi:hypothetical protein
MSNYDKLKHIIQDFLNEQPIKQEMNESGYAATARTMRGLRKNIKTIAILSAENPFGKPATPSYNKKTTKDMKKLLGGGKFGYKLVKGSYGSEENSIIINNISKGDAMAIGEIYDQDSIIYGEVVDKKDNGVYMVFTMIGTDKNKNYGKVMGETKVFIDRNDATDFYSQIKGRKFVLPFYDVIDYLEEPNGKSFEISKDYSDTKWVGGKAGPSKITTKELSNDDQELEEELNILQESVLKTVGSTSYNYRGRIRELIEKNNLL